MNRIKFLFLLMVISTAVGVSGQTTPDKTKVLKDLGEKIEPQSFEDELKMNWREPKSGNPKLYDKIEWQITLPDEVELAVRNWISNEEKNTRLTPAINPFDPEQIDLSAEILYQKNGNQIIQPVYGFFTRDYKRETKGDPNFWTWKETNNDIVFLIRWAADTPGGHEVRVKLHIPGLKDWQLPPFFFVAESADAANSFIKLSDNKHFFATDNGNIYMPLGLNITEASFGCNCMEGVAPVGDCNRCYEWGKDDPCCGIDARKKNRSGIPGTTLRDYTVVTAGYVKLEKVLKALKDAGGNSFRSFLDPLVFDVEFEKMNNYFDRQYQAFEFDKMLEVCHDLNLRMELNLQYHFSITYHSYGGDRFDWDSTYNCLDCGPDYVTTGTKGWCYNRECPEVETPIDFLKNECARKNYKKKLRYIIARWGYSSNIFLFDLMSEMNNIGNGSIWETNVDTDGDGQKDDNREVQIQSLYYKDPANRVAVADWHHEMARYIKEELKHDRHLIAADYTGQSPMDSDFNGDGDCNDAEIGENCNPCLSKYFDYSWMSPYIDVIAFSNYSGGLNRWEKSADQEYYKNSQSNGLMCGWNNPEITEDDNGYNSPLGGYESLWKPIVHAEAGLTSCMDGDYTGFYKDLMTDAMGGHANGGMSWDEWSSVKHWTILGEINSFLTNQVYSKMNPAIGNWRPQHSYSQNKTGQKKTKFAESIFMQNTTNGDAFGFVMNRTWNYLTTGSGSCLKEERRNDFRGSDQPLSSFKAVNWDSDRIYLEGFSSGKFEIEYFNPANNQSMGKVEVKSGRKGLPLEAYPMLDSGNGVNKPYCFFVIRKIS